MCIVFVLNLWLNPGAAAELRDSVNVPDGDEPLGEQELTRWAEEKRH